MTELPIDTLIIIGLVIASFVGKFFQKKEGEKSKRTGGKPSTGNPEPTIEDVFREAWEKATQPQEQEEPFEATPPPLPVEPPPLYEERPIERSVALAKPRQKPAKVTHQPYRHRQVSIRSANAIDASPKVNHSWVREELFGGSDSLKKAIVLKEILDQPKSLRLP